VLNIHFATISQAVAAGIRRLLWRWLTKTLHRLLAIRAISSEQHVGRVPETQLRSPSYQ
jgi:hypothetical protein